MVIIAILLLGCTRNNSNSGSGVNNGTSINQGAGQVNNSNTQPSNNGQQQNGGNSPPSEAISACSGKAIGDSCQFTSKDGILSGTCNDKPGVLACAPGIGGGNKQNNTNVKPNPPGQNNTAPRNDTNIQPKPPGQNTTAPSNGTNVQPKPPESNISAPKNDSQSGYNIEQAISDKAQLNTMAFGGLGFLTGNLCSDSFLPPGKVSDFFGFQYLRDVTQSGKGHSTDFVTNAANNVLFTLNTAQKAKMIALAKTQAPLVNEFAYGRYPLMTAFRRQLDGDIPSGTTGLSKNAVIAYSSNLYELDANISLQRAKLFAEILNSLDSTQKLYFDNMETGGFASWPALADQVDKTTLTHDEHVLVMTYASEMFAWYAGDVEADTYFCPERQADYFGGFYIKDAPAIGNAGYTIDESITGDAGEAFIAVLDSTQQPIITSLVDTQRTAINGIVEKRRAISTELRKVLASQTIDESNVLLLSKEYGALDGEISYYYATAFSEVGQTLTAEQKAKMIEIKNLDGYTCDAGKIYLYSEKIDQPTIPNTDFLFE